MSPSIRLLIIEDSPTDAEITLQQLRQFGFFLDWQRVDNQPDFLAALHSNPDIILSNYQQAQLGAAQALQILRQQHQDIPLIVVTHSQSEEIAVECLKQGCADYVLKNNISRLGKAVSDALEEKKQRSQQQQTELLLQETQARYLRLAENLPDIIYRYRLTPPRGFEYVSPAALTITGYSAEEHYADPNLGSKIVHPDDRDVFNEWVNRQPMSDFLVLRWIHKNGSIIWTEIRPIPIYDERGNLIAVEGVTRDITLAKNAQESLQKSEARYRAIVEEQTELICRFLGSGILTFVNSAYARFFNLDRKELIGRNFLAGVVVEECTKLWNSLGRLSPDDPVCTFEHCYEAGAIRQLEWTIRALFDEQESFIEFQAVGRDITAVKKAEQAFQTAHQELEVYVEQRIRELRRVNEQLKSEISRRKQAQTALRQRFNQLQALYYLADAIGRAISNTEIYEAGLNAIYQTFRSQYSGILIWETGDKKSDNLLINNQNPFDFLPLTRLCFKAARGIKEIHEKGIEDYLSGYSQASKQAVIISNIETLRMSNIASGKTILLEAGIGSVAFIPLVFQGRVLGQLMVGYTGPHNFSETELLQAKTIANHIAFSIERKRSLAAMRESEERFRRVFDDSPVGMVLVLAESYRFLKVNAAFSEIVGYTESELTGLTLTDITYPEDKLREMAYINRTLNKEIDRYQIEKRFITKTGQLVWVHLTTAVIQNEDGEMLYALGMVEDISVRKKSEEALQFSEEKFRQLAENIREVFWIATPDLQQMIYMSPGYEEIWRRSCASVYEQPLSWLDAVHPEDRPQLFGISIPLSEGVPVCQEFRIVLPDNSIRWIWNRCFPIRNSLGMVYRIAGIAEDVTERKQSIVELHQSLETEKQLNEIKSRFVSMVSHEFRNPLTSIVMSVELLQHYGEQSSQEKKLRYLQRIKAAANQMTDLLENVLVIGKVEAGKLAFEPAPLDVEEFCRELLEDCKLALNFPAVSYSSSGRILEKYKDFPKTVFLPCLDDKLLRHILTNLLSNAIKYSPLGGTVRLMLTYLDQEVIFQVQDQGIGIPADDLPLLFEAFHRAGNVGKIPGTGLGLAIVKKAVDLHGGTISVESKIATGTTFTVRLPVRYEPKVYTSLKEV
ncbi:PAS domain S-box protein [Ancylothrix sp. C2]|uniref:PAS domain S-box protein n=1 Tax=Ancylothrix sp. D3o TaxID=2953691 RepID=UPI0021BAF898|nr:PAS domain S-box protein [Ancylothrix sp. D3o]MCT7952509.1 PAS domain S-box protein [Ancylothrix sp. D3o]